MNDTKTMTSLSSDMLKASLNLIEVKPGLKFAKQILQNILPDVETALFFGKVYELNAQQLGYLLQVLFDSDLLQALTGQDTEHSTDLQDYLVEIVPDLVTQGEIAFNPSVPHGEILPEVWDSLKIEVAQSIKDVAAKLAGVVGMMPGKKGSMVFKSMMQLNAKRGSIGDYRATIHHERHSDNLVILDVSGSMTRGTIERIINDVVALSYTANAHLAIVSNDSTTWAPGEYDVDSVLRAAQFGGTHYETLAPLLDQDWGVVVTIADYDSSADAKSYIRGRATGSIDTVLDLSLVNQPTFLAECVGQLAREVKPLLISPGHRPLSS